MAHAMSARALKPGACFSKAQDFNRCFAGMWSSLRTRSWIPPLGERHRREASSALRCPRIFSLCRCVGGNEPLRASLRTVCQAYAMP